MQKLPKGWKIIEFKKGIEKDSVPSKIKIKNSEFKEFGKYPIIDQGEKFIAGYYNDKTKLFPYKGSVIVFGDHTKRIKYIDFKFCVGADGTKVLIPKKRYFDTKFFYYQLKYIPLENAGYSRHYRFLVRKRLLVPPLPTQKKIVEILDKAEKLKTRRADANAETNKILQSVFLEMFGDPVKNEKGWEIKKLREVCEINPKKSEIAELDDNTEITFLPMVSVSEEGKTLNKEIKKLGDVRKGFTYFREKDVLFAKITPCMENGKRAIVTELKNGIGFGTTEFHVIRAKENINPYWVFGLISLEKFRKIAEINMTGTAGQKRVPTDFLKNFRVPIPPLKLQNQFAEIVEKVEKIKERQKDSTKEINDLFNALMQKAFKGELD